MTQPVVPVPALAAVGSLLSVARQHPRARPDARRGWEKPFGVMAQWLSGQNVA